MSERMIRDDGRLCSQLRPVTVDFSYIHRGDGSVRLTMGGTVVLAVVYGPAAARLQYERMDRATVEVSVKPSVGPSGPSERELECLLRQTLEAVLVLSCFPRTIIKFAIQVVSDDGSLRANAINASILAAIDAGLPLSSVVAAITMCLGSTSQLRLTSHVLPALEKSTEFDWERDERLKHTTYVVLDPTKQEESQAETSLLFAYSNPDPENDSSNSSPVPSPPSATRQATNGLVVSMVDGPITIPALQSMWTLSVAATATIVGVMRTATLRKHSNTLG